MPKKIQRFDDAQKVEINHLELVVSGRKDLPYYKAPIEGGDKKSYSQLDIAEKGAK